MMNGMRDSLVRTARGGPDGFQTAWKIILRQSCNSRRVTNHSRACHGDWRLSRWFSSGVNEQIFFS
jgi:hypothetical protein